MKQEANAGRRFLSAAGGVTDLDELLTDQQRRKVELEDELKKTEVRLVDVEQRLRADVLHTYTTMTGAQVDLAQVLADNRTRYGRLNAELAHLNLQLEDTLKRIAAFDRGR